MSKRILLVEDEPDGREVVGHLLAFGNIESDMAETAEDALEILAEGSDYDAIVIDLALPGMDGFQLLNTLRQDEKTAHLPCIAITAYHDSGVRHEAMSKGFNAYFPKPLDEMTFAKDVASAIS